MSLSKAQQEMMEEVAWSEQYGSGGLVTGNPKSLRTVKSLVKKGLLKITKSDGGIQHGKKWEVVVFSRK